MKPTNEVVLRTAVLALTWLNMILVGAGWRPLPFTDAQVYDGASLVVAFAASVWAWWKNNSITKKAIEADKYKETL